ncbi:hypothetical protein [Halococcus sp. PRR34]|uniref:hypothetical protein n=1 Tax=Halococcus sp. PRR34 TaxID=3020830 RepID=UPI0023620BC3|nr:hypothetical protein [Halococcus sp. PRR34]
MDRRKGIALVVVIVLITAGIAGVTGLVAAQAQSGNGSGNATGNSTDDTAFDDPSAVGNNSSIDDPSTVGNSSSFDDPSSVGNNSSINNSSSSLNTNVSYKAPENVTGGNASGNNSSFAGAPSVNNSSSASGAYSKCSGGILDALMSGNLNMTCRLQKWIFGAIFGGMLKIIQDIWDMFVGALFTTPAPAVNGDPAFFGEPTNQPWQTLWNISMFRMIPIGLVIWGFIFLCSLGVTSLLPLGPHGEYKKRQMNNKAVLAFIGIIGSWGLGSAFLWLTKGATRAIMPEGGQIASDASLVLANAQGAILLVAAAYLTGGTMVAYFALLIIFRLLMAGIFMIGLPVLIPLVMVDVGPLKYISNSIERFIDVSIMFIIMVIPMGLVLQGGYAVINGLNQGSDVGSTALSAVLTSSGANAALVLAVWILTGLVPLFMYRQLGQVKGIASSMMTAGRRASDRLKELSESDPSEVDNGPDYGPGSMRPDDILEDTDVQRSSDTGRFGGALGDGRVHAGDGDGPVGMLGRGPGMLADPRDPNASSTPNRLDEGHPAASALPGGEGGQQTGGGGGWSQFTDRVGNVGDWAGNARSNLNDRINNAREMGGTVRDNGGNFVAGAAGATAGFFGAGASEENSGGATRDTTRSDVGSHTTSTSDSTSGSVNQSMGGNVEEQPDSTEGSYYREAKGEQIYVPQSTGGLPSHVDTGVIKSDGFNQHQEGVETDTAAGEFSRMGDNFADQDDVFAARDPESGQLYDLSEVDTDQQPPERDRDAEERHKGSARDVQNARRRTDD